MLYDDDEVLAKKALARQFERKGKEIPEHLQDFGTTTEPSTTPPDDGKKTYNSEPR